MKMLKKIIIISFSSLIPLFYICFCFFDGFNKDERTPLLYMIFVSAILLFLFTRSWVLIRFGFRESLAVLTSLMSSWTIAIVFMNICSIIDHGGYDPKAGVSLQIVTASGIFLTALCFIDHFVSRKRNSNNPEENLWEHHFIDIDSNTDVWLTLAEYSALPDKEKNKIKEGTKRRRRRNGFVSDLSEGMSDLKYEEAWKQQEDEKLRKQLEKEDAERRRREKEVQDYFDWKDWQDKIR